MTQMPNLFYVDGDEVREVPYTRDRAMCVYPLFHKTRREALIAVKDNLTDEVNKRVARIVEIERELAGVNHA